jgi:hypothetical protein
MTKPATRRTVFRGTEIIEVRELEVDWYTLREHRDKALTQSDWRALKDLTMSQAWKDYRQALRDLPQNYNSANDAADNWPEPPE